MNRRIVDLWYDVENRMLITENGTSQEAAPTPYVFFKENILIRLRLMKYDVTTSAYIAYTDLAATDVFSFALDDDYDYTSELWIKENNSSINVAGDWESGGTADPTLGEISIRIDMNTTSIESALGTTSAIAGIAELQIRPLGEIAISGCMSWAMSVFNLVDSVYWVELENSVDYTPTAASPTLIPMLTDQTLNIIQDASLRVYWDDTYHYGLASSISASMMRVWGLDLPLGAAGLEEVWYEVMPSTIRNNYYTVDELAALLAAKQDTAVATENHIAVFGNAGSTVDSGKYFVNSVTGNSYLEVPTVPALRNFVISATGAGITTPAGSTWGDVLYRGETAWERLPAGASGSYLMSQAAGAPPVFVNPPKLPAPIDGEVLIANGGIWDGLAAGEDGKWLKARGVGVTPIWDSGAELPNSATGSILWKAFPGASGWEALSSTDGDVLYFDGSSWVTLPVGADGQILSLNGTLPYWRTLGVLPAGVNIGDVQYFDGVDWVALSPGIDGQLLRTRGIGSSPIWGSGSGVGDVLGPLAHADGYIPRWDGVDSKTLLEGFGVASGMVDIPATGSHNWILDSVGTLDAIEDRGFSKWALPAPASVSPTPQVCDTVTAVDGGSWEWPYRMIGYGIGGAECNARSGHVLAMVGSIASGLYESTEWATQEIGNCTEDEVDFTVDIDSGNLRLLATIASGGNWYIKGKRMRVDW